MRASKSLMEIIKNVTKPNILQFMKKKKQHSLEIERITTIEIDTARVSSTAEISERTSFCARWMMYHWARSNCSFRHFRKKIIRSRESTAPTMPAEYCNLAFIRLCGRLFPARLLLLRRLIKHSIFSLSLHVPILQAHTNSSRDNCSSCVYTRHHRYAKTYLLDVMRRRFMAMY